MNNIRKLNEQLERLMYDLENEDKLQLNEMSTVYKGNGIYIAVNPDEGRNWEGIEYFKIYNHTNYKAATKMTRINFRNAEYTYHTTYGLEDWVLNSKEKKELIKLLKSKHKHFNTVWQFAIGQFNSEMLSDGSVATDFKDLTIEKQNQMEENNPLKHYLPIDLPMPNYLEL